jgi:hypothetical protein
MTTSKQPSYITIRYDIPPRVRNESQVKLMLQQLLPGGSFEYYTTDASNFYQQAKKLGIKITIQNCKLSGFFRVWRKL